MTNWPHTLQHSLAKPAEVFFILALQGMARRTEAMGEGSSRFRIVFNGAPPSIVSSPTKAVRSVVILVLPFLSEPLQPHLVTTHRLSKLDKISLTIASLQCGV
ncbi:MAG: hypothetical protein QOJ51_5158 [Acidobacteriaceae bacterium]|nr:hypothetical protein [Acidobacteriaceae bacterium]